MTCKNIHKFVYFNIDISHLYIFSVDLYEMKLFTCHRYVSLSTYLVFLYLCYAVYIPDSGVNGIY